jgi:transcriptional regulator with XRE-family HTH domain
MPDISTRIYIGQRIKTLRRQQDMTLKALADKLDISPQMISLYERGEADPPSSRVLQFAQALHVQPGDLYPPTPEEVVGAN